MLQSLNNKNRLLLDYRLVREGREDLTFNVDLALTIGEGIVGILGDSGTGKSTLLKALAGLMN
jgi:ABC-type sulfate/molybdate transport systems ATPase subunit